jgi:triacylglycerol lipase
VTPVLLVHGIWDTATRLEPLRAGLVARGLAEVHAVDLAPNDGRASICELGLQVAGAVRALSRGRRVDVVGFSMGALVVRWYLQRGGGKEHARRFVSIAGPHHGTLTAFALPRRYVGVTEMRPGSPLLKDLASDSDPFGPVQVHCVYTPLDLMIIPARSSVLPAARTVRAFSVAMHRLLITDRRVLDHVAATLRAP